MNNYHFTFTKGGKDVNGKPITDKATYHMYIKADNQTKAEKQLRSMFFRSVVLTITSTIVTSTTVKTAIQR